MAKNQELTVGIAGLGLIGGSLAKAYKRNSGIRVFGCDKNDQVQEIAKISGAIDDYLDMETIKECDMIFLALYPEAASEYLKQNALMFPKSSIVMDCCGIKRKICETGFALARKHGFTFVGGHPMAGTHHSGFSASTAELFDGACMVTVPANHNDTALLDRIRRTVQLAGFSSISVSSAERHDEIIAFTSQLAHVVSNAYIKSPTAVGHMGFSAGSYKDLTRVAWLDPNMWTALFMENRDNLINEIDVLIKALTEYRIALNNYEVERLRALLDEGRRRKQEVDGGNKT